MIDKQPDQAKPRRTRAKRAAPPAAGSRDSPPTTVRKVSWHQKLDLFEKHPTVRLIKLLGSSFAFLVLVGTAFQLLDDLGAREQDRIDAALTRIQIRSGGNTGKALAINTLIDANRPISNLNFSCERIGDWSDAEARCVNPVVFEGLSLQMPDKPSRFFDISRRVDAFIGSGGDEAPLSSINFSDAVFDDLGAENLSMQNIDFDRAAVRDGSLAGSRIQGSFRDALFSDTDLSGAELTGDLSGVRFSRSNLSGAFISGLAEAAAMEDVFAWLDAPPVRYERETPDGLVNMRAGDITDYPPQPEEVLRQVIFCAVPLKDREKVPFERRGRLTLETCERVDQDDALAEIARLYTRM